MLDTEYILNNFSFNLYKHTECQVSLIDCTSKWSQISQLRSLSPPKCLNRPKVLSVLDSDCADEGQRQLLSETNDCNFCPQIIPKTIIGQIVSQIVS